MNKIELKARAKINLSLDVLRKRPDNYHDVRMIMQTIELHDNVFMTAVDEGISVVCNHRFVPSGSENIAYKAAKLFMTHYHINKGVKVVIDKKIPVSAGLAGGSSNAAAVLKGLNTLFGLNLDLRTLAGIGESIGADVPFCIKGGTMLAEGIGEILTDLHPMPPTDIVLIKPKLGVSTPWVYKNLDLDNIPSRPDTELLINAIKDNAIDVLAGNMRNVLESVTVKKYSVIEEIKSKLIEFGALGSMMSGSGPSVFGIFEDSKTAYKAYEAMKSTHWDCFLTGTICEER